MDADLEPIGTYLRRALGEALVAAAIRRFFVA